MIQNIVVKGLAVAALMVSAQSFAWGTTGHRVIAEVAENNLKPSARHQLKKLIGNQKLAYWANWPDFIKSDTTGHWKHADVWHYVNIAPQSNFQSFENALREQKGPSLYTEIKTTSEKLSNRNLSKEEREINLRFLIHLMGDLSQPMHTGRAEDLGGNLIKLKFFGDNTNLHSLWDGKLVDHNKYSYTEYARVLDVLSKKEKKDIMKGSLEEWLYDSHQIANTLYSYTEPAKNYSYDYVYRFQSTLERQLYYGGLRLAKVLNEVL